MDGCVYCKAKRALTGAFVQQSEKKQMKNSMPCLLETQRMILRRIRFRHTVLFCGLTLSSMRWPGKGEAWLAHPCELEANTPLILLFE